MNWDRHRVARLQWSNDRGMEIRASGQQFNVCYIAESGWTGEADELVKYATNSTQGFALILAGLKASLEHNIQMNYVKGSIP